MATSRQEKTYNEIIGYYDYADRLIQDVENLKHKYAKEQFSVVEDLVEHIEEHADRLTTGYIEYVKDENKVEILQDLQSSLADISQRIAKCRQQVEEIQSRLK